MKIIMHTKICDIIAIANKHVEMLEFANKYEASLSFFFIGVVSRQYVC